MTTEGGGEEEEGSSHPPLPPAPPFNEEFYFPREEQLINIIQEEVGCFNCNTQVGAKKTCSACKIAKYCSKQCQQSNWKGNSAGAKGKEQPHNVVCKAVRTFRTQNLPFPFILPVVGGFSSGMLASEMNLYSNLFLNALSKAKVQDISLIVLCTEDSMFGDQTVRLIGTARFITDLKVCEIHNVIHKQVDKGEDAVASLYPSSRTSNDIFGSVLSKEAKEKAISYLVDFIKRLHKKYITVKSVTCGRGLAFLESDKDSQQLFKEANGESFNCIAG